MLRACRAVLAALASWEQQEILQALTGLWESLGVKNAKLLWPLRIAISGQQSTPGGAIEIAYLLGKEETLRRVDDGIRRVSEMPDA